MDALAGIVCAILLTAMIGYPLFYPRLWPALLLITIAGLPFAVVAAAQTTLLQTVPEPAVRGRVFGAVMAATGAAQVVGILASGYLADRTSVYLLLADAPCYLLAGLIILGSRRRDEQPARQD
jgi:MFS family permease